MIVLRATDVRFVRGGADLATSFSFELAAGETFVLAQPQPYAASLAARLCAAIVKPTSGTVRIDDYDSRLQQPEAKRRIGFVDARGFDGDAHAFRCEVAFHAATWGIAVARARERADAVLRALASDAPYARGIALALVAEVSALVLDAPPSAFVAAARSLAPGACIVHVRS